MFLLVEGMNIGQAIKIAVLTAIPIVILVAVWIYLKNQMETESQSLSKSMQAMDEEILMIAKQKLAQRQSQPSSDSSVTQKQLDKKEIEERLKAERKEYDEFELVEPLEDLKNTDDKQD